MEHNKITQIHPQTIQPQPPTPSPNTSQLVEALVQRLAQAQSEQHIHYHVAPPSQTEQNTQALLQSVAGLAIIFLLTLGTLSTVILIWRGAQATSLNYQTHTIQ